MSAALVQLSPSAEAPGLALTADQRRALALIERVVSAGHGAISFGVINGYAGTGKTTLLKQLGHLNPLQLAPTGKAALRLLEATGVPSYTIHRVLYAVFEDDDGDPHFKPRNAQPPSGCKLIVVDEASMVSERVFNDVLAWAALHRLPVVFVGDRAQLPPVAHRGEDAFSVLKVPTPHRVDMTEVVRQAATSPVLAASLQLRRGAWREAFARFPRVGPGVLVEEAYDVFQRGGMVITHSNRTRTALNAALRELQGYPAGIQPGEPLLVLRNNYGLDRYNGEVVLFNRWSLPPEAVFWEAGQREVHPGIAELEGGREAWLCQEGVDGLGDGREVRRLAREYQGTFAEHFSDPLPFLQAEYGYALTCHKSQGSESDDVLVVIEPSVPLNSREGWQWAYTAITRARHRVRLQFGLGGLRLAPRFQEARQ